ncbi:MAG: hypothetical protein NTY02_00780 [Acidobacteria bacterium]|nr:hypothetical protein [Acidobacteriota bacterium]
MAAHRILVAGAGFIARKGLETIAARADVELVGMVSRSEARALAAVEAAGLKPVPVHADWTRAIPTA